MSTATSTDDMYEQAYWSAQKALDEFIGPDEDDGEGAGLVADIYLLGRQRDEARAKLTAVAASLDEIGKHLQVLRERLVSEGATEEVDRAAK